MIAMIFKLTGGIGLFLLGMVLLTDGLKTFAGDALRRALIRFTGTPAKAFLSGALVTALVQSSSATTVTVIGFVSAGLLTFPQAIGVVFGASLGTTGTGWIIAGLGLKISVGFYALPLVGIGAFLRLLTTGRSRSLGLALAGFGLIFVGIETLQDGMRGLTAAFDFTRLPSESLLGHLIAMVIGILLTVVMQSSSAAVATTLTALHTGVISFDQAASLVIGAAVGTTITGALAAIGGTVSAKRTALAHVSFNLATGIIAIALLPVFLGALHFAQERDWLEPGAMSLAAFHSLFVAVGVAIFLPLVHKYARLIERILPDRDPPLTRHLDQTLLQAPAVALEATRRALAETAADTLRLLRETLQHPDAIANDLRAEKPRRAMEEIEHFFHRIPPINEDQPLSRLRVNQMHAIDHLVRIQTHQRSPSGLPGLARHEPLQPALILTQEVLAVAEAGLRGAGAGDWVERVAQQAATLAELRRQNRPMILQETAGGMASPSEALALLDAMRWLDRLSYHAWRISHYVAGNGVEENGNQEPAEERDI
ncbi:MAG TPA: Na/Pi cotransporter family protein [Kiritimatiellia bacterium]|nr:Na/Pi cotransporter family protein [Kiritimatiellia bacterium]HMO97957.1 Na/Pi cotransporter family protein [Kiritimatiellia bacterium]HMP95308.1 Na/Pi cotransporter family protein [Kiritimatiellia bacterium]